MSLKPILLSDDFRYISLQIVKDMSYSEGRQLNTFTTVDAKGRPIAGSEIAKRHDHYKKGYFWARDWYANGADENKMGEKEFPVLAYECRERELKNIKGEGCDEIYLTIFDQFECEDCDRLEEEVSKDCKKMLLAYIEELYTYGCYEIDGSYQWLSKGRVKYLQEKGELSEFLEPDAEIEDFIPFRNNNKMKEWAGFSDDVVGWSIMFSVCNCETSGINFNYNHSLPEPVEKADCLSCQ